MGGIKQEQTDVAQQPRPSHSADQRADEVGAGPSINTPNVSNYFIDLYIYMHKSVQVQ